MKFTSKGERSGFNLDIVHLTDHGLTKVRTMMKINQHLDKDHFDLIGWHMVSRDRRQFQYNACVKRRSIQCDIDCYNDCGLSFHQYIERIERIIQMILFSGSTVCDV